MTISTTRALPVTIRPGAPLKDNPARLGADWPTQGPLVDSFGRVHTDLRLSITDRCNFRCTYCMPEEGLQFLERADVLTFAEIARFASVARSLGVSSVRITGGEPLIRKGIVDFVAALTNLGFDDIALTTNGSHLAPLAADLARAGLRRVNVSCDSLREQRFSEIRRRGTLSTVLSAMDAADRAGLRPLKVNVVLVKGSNDDEIVDFARFARESGRVVRFIEFMPLDADGAWQRDLVVPGDEVYRIINEHWPLQRVDDPLDPAPATRFCFEDGAGEIGIISSVTRPFCGTCNRLRLTADGAIRNCLFSDNELSVRELLRSGGADAEIATMLRRAVWGKLPGHGINDPNFLRPQRSMSMIGG